MIFGCVVILQDGHLEVVEFLLEKGAKVDIARSDGVTPLGMAANVRIFF